MNKIKMVAKSELQSWELIRSAGRYFLRARTSKLSFLIELDPMQIVGECYGVISVYSYIDDENLAYYCAESANIKHRSGTTYYFKAK